MVFIALHGFSRFLPRKVGDLYDGINYPTTRKHGWSSNQNSDDVWSYPPLTKKMGSYWFYQGELGLNVIKLRKSYHETWEFHKGKAVMSQVDRRLNQRKNLWIFNRPTFGTSESKLTKLDGQNGGWSASICIKTLVNVFDPKKQIYVVYGQKNELMVPSHSNISTLLLFSIAMENGPFIDDKHDDLPEMVIYQKWWFSISNRSITRW